VGLDYPIVAGSSTTVKISSVLGPSKGIATATDVPVIGPSSIAFPKLQLVGHLCPVGYPLLVGQLCPVVHPLPVGQVKPVGQQEPVGQ